MYTLLYNTYYTKEFLTIKRAIKLVSKKKNYTEGTFEV